MDGATDYHAKLKRERQVSSDIAYMWDLKYDTNEIQNRNRLTDIGNTLVIAKGDKDSRVSKGDTRIQSLGLVEALSNIDWINN